MPKRFTGLRILVAEDEPLIAMDVEAMLQALGVARIALAHGIDSANRLLDEERFDGAILDLRLGSDSSIDLAERLQQLGLPLGFLTGYAGDAIPAPFRTCPVVAKPFAEPELVQLMEVMFPGRA